MPSANTGTATRAGCDAAQTSAAPVATMTAQVNATAAKPIQSERSLRVLSSSRVKIAPIFRWVASGVSVGVAESGAMFRLTSYDTSVLGDGIVVRRPRPPRRRQLAPDRVTDPVELEDGIDECTAFVHVGQGLG